MSLDLEQVYFEENLNLIKSIVVKNELDLFAVQQGMKSKYTYDEVASFPGEDINFHNWKYYQNINGLYHTVSIDGELYSTDKTIKVVSFDDRTEIVFNKANLELHPLTKLEYSPGTQYHKELIEKHPKLENLIHRILNPIDINEAKEAPNGTILQFDSSLLSENEFDVIPRLQKWAYGFFNRYQIKDMQINNPYYAHSFNALFYSSMLTELVNIRHSNCKTNRVSPFHLWSYLGSKFEIDQFREFLTLDQALWLYRNIDYLIKNAGKEETLHLLLENIIYPRGLNAFGFKMVKLDGQLVTRKQSDVRFTRHPMEKGKEDKVIGQFRALEIIKKTLDKAVYNRKCKDKDVLNLNETLRYGDLNEQPIKLIEIVEKANPIANMFDIKLILLYYWSYLTHLGKYRGYVGIDFPGNFVKNISMIDNFVLFVYALNKSVGTDLDGNENVIEDLLDEEVPYIIVPGLIDDKPVDYRAMVNKYCTSYFTNKEAIIKVLQDNQLALPSVQNVGEFAAFAEKVKARAIKLWIAMLDNTRTNHGRNEVRELYSQVDRTQAYRLKGKGYTFKNFFDELELSTEFMTKEDWKYVLAQSVSGGIGRGLDDGQMADYQQAMVKLFDKLTSYNLNVVKGLSSAGIVSIPWQPPEFLAKGDTYGSYHDSVDIGVSLSSSALLNIGEMKLDLTYEAANLYHSSIANPLDLNASPVEYIIHVLEPTPEIISLPETKTRVFVDISYNDIKGNSTLTDINGNVVS